MGKAQSKRSIDITTDPKKAGEGDEVAGKVEKIEDADQAAAPAVNGDAATPQEKSADEAGAAVAAASEKKDTTEESSENDKDLTTEKSAAEVTPKTDGAAGDAPADVGKDEAGSASPKEGGAEEISPLADESIKSKSKKDKMKKKWSFRSISFGKKDKQKPAKVEEPTSPTAAATTTNAEAATTNGESTAAAASPESVEVAATTSAEASTPVENGAANEKEKEQATSEDKTPAATASEKPAATKSESAPAESKVEPAPVAVPESVATAVVTEVVTNGHSAEEPVVEAALTNGAKNGFAESSVEPIAEQHHQQNGTNGVTEGEGEQDKNGENGSATPPPTPVAESEAEQIKNKSQIEVKQLDNDNTNTHTTVNTITTTTTETTIETETIAAAELVQTQTTTNTNTQNNTVPNITTTSTANTTTVSLSSTNQAQEVAPIETQTQVETQAEEEQVVAAIIAAVSSEPNDPAEGFVLVAPKANEKSEVVEHISEVVEIISQDQDPQQSVDLVNESQVKSSVDIREAEVDIEAATEISQPPPLPKSPPPSRVSAFALATEEETQPEEEHDKFVEAEKQHKEIIDEVKKPVEEKQEEHNPKELSEDQEEQSNEEQTVEMEEVENEGEQAENVKEQDDETPVVQQGVLLAQIEQQAHVIVDEITEQAADFVMEQDKLDLPAAGESGVEEQVQPMVTDMDEDDVKEELSAEQSKMIDELSLRLEQDTLELEENEHQLNDIVEHNKDDSEIISCIESITKLAIDDPAQHEDIAKDLKEKNAAADVTTQELAVTCE
ncbi:A-kinase anchor protein 200 isoform X2 [Drosophila busckii]|uniref:A-kinase anchor protein 200 isoform X2 n=1 Tax=Drosophila busckii TaxID=30019 RepID=UPI0014328954|nr:A-kinase anchor protein 200 isoform X2 [Drosophila busckii]